VESAVHQFEAWLRSVEQDDAPPVQTTGPAPVTRAPRDGTRDDDAGATEPQTAGS
jgi:hypothetical protein